jgi:tetratricopeptide (TPR) repeat protein
LLARAMLMLPVMKTTLSALLFALVASACGGQEPKNNMPPITSPVAQTPADAAEPVAEVKPPRKPDPTSSEPVAMPTKFDDALAQARELMTKGDHSRAKELLEAAIKLDKHRAEPHVELSRLYIETGDKGMAVAAANKAVKLAPNSSQAWNTKGRAELNRFAYDNAVEAFTKSVELNRDNVWAWNNLGFTYLQLKKYDDAATALTEATTRKGATGYMFNNLGTALEQLDKLDDARVAFENGGKLGSLEAAASRKRLEGVKSIAIAKEEQETKKIDDKKGYDLNEGQIDEDKKMEGSGSGSGSGSSSDTETK